MSYICGGALQKRLDQDGPLPLGEVLRIGSRIAAGLAVAHEQGLIHCWWQDDSLLEHRRRIHSGVPEHQGKPKHQDQSSD